VSEQRERLAAQALQGILSNPHYAQAADRAIGANPEKIAQVLSAMAVTCADALIAALKREQP
jgi:hypothetical protein